MTFNLRKIGSTGVKVTDVAFGCASIGNLYREIMDADALSVLESAWDSGIRYFDTAPHYGRGLSEQRLGKFLTIQQRSNFVISTKVGRVLSAGKQVAEADSYINPLPNDVRYDYSGDGIEESLEGSRTRLGSKYIDIVYVHDIGQYTHGDDNAKHMDDFLGSGYERLVKLKQRGDIGAIGLGVNENEVCIEIMRNAALDVILLAGRLTLLDRSAEDVLVPLCRASNTSLVLGGIFNSGILATGAIDGATYDYEPASESIKNKVIELQNQATAMNIPLATAALHFARRHYLSASVLLGTAKPKSLIRNIDALNNTVPKEFGDIFGEK